MVEVDDGNGGTDQATLEITVINTNDAPTFSSDPIVEVDATEDAAYSGTIADEATDPDLQLRMQGNAFLGAFFAVSPLLARFGIDNEHYREVVLKQYKKKFGRFGDAVVSSNMEVMTQGSERVREIPVGELKAPDRSTLRGLALTPVNGGCGSCRSVPPPPEQAERIPVTRVATFDKEFRAGLGYHQPASALSSVGVMAAASGDTASKYVARRETPMYIPENCTQCMECIAICPDTAGAITDLCRNSSRP